MAAYTERIPYDVYFLLLAQFAFGAFIVRGSACTVNDIFDREFDAAVGELTTHLVVIVKVLNMLYSTDRADEEPTIGFRQGIGSRCMDFLLHSNRDRNSVLLEV